MRKNPTTAEKLLWAKLRRRNLGAKFRRQYPILGFFPDFCCLEHHLIIEIDGDSHTEQPQYDEWRTEKLAQLGYLFCGFLTTIFTTTLKEWSKPYSKPYRNLRLINNKGRGGRQRQAPPPSCEAMGEGIRHKSKLRGDFLASSSTQNKHRNSGVDNAAVLIIAGGRGTRFWPESRINRPKPLFAIDGKTSLLAATVLRMQPLIAPDRIFVLAAADQAPLFRPVLKNLIPPRNLIVEPEGRGTAVAITYGAGVIAKRLREQTVVAVMPADHYVTPATAFQRTLRDAIRLAATYPAIVVIGIRPIRPETGYGYLKIGQPVDLLTSRRPKPDARNDAGRVEVGVAEAGNDNPEPLARSVAGEGKGEGSTSAFRLDRFVEKPDAATAAKMIGSGDYLWNAGMFVMSASTLAAELAEHAHRLADAMRALPSMRGAQLEQNYHSLNFDAFDRVVAEKSHNVLGVHARFTWHDVGSWEGLWEALRGRGRNVMTGNVLDMGSEGALVRARDHLIVLLGVKDIVAIETDDVILIANRTQSQDVRKVIDELKRRGADRYL
jgi:mannose-1-phosphate guanylyltransferase